MADLRVGCGYDVHAFTPGRRLVLGGIQIEHNCGLAGDSDADVLTHAVVDALLGAAGYGDIGDHCPVGDERYLEARSVGLLARIAEQLRGSGWHVLNLDTTLIAQEPRLASQRAAIRQGLAAALGLDSSRVSVKATTTDHLGSIGRAEGIAAQAVVLLERVSGDHETDQGARGDLSP